MGALNKKGATFGLDPPKELELAEMEQSNFSILKFTKKVGYIIWIKFDIGVRFGNLTEKTPF